MQEIGLYIHVPFCVQKCHYCDFLSHPYREREANEYLGSLLREMELASASPEVGKRPVATLYIGGGTPTCLPVLHLERIIDESFNHFDITGGAEVTVEANPGTLTPDTLRALMSAGMNRLSLGVQS